jgi:protein tyrosine phosphatase (PTP) superfamily phosphohydrolase (DUF442 family)
MQSLRRPPLTARCIFLIAALWLATAAAAADDAAPPNLVAISDKLVTSGQPSAAWLAQLKRNGFDAVIYLAPPTVSDAVRDEATIVGRQGLVFVNLPIDFSAPTERDYEAFAGVMRALGDRRVLVHCQVNLRASSLTFLYRAVALKQNPESAYDAVSRVWKPDGVWRQFIVAQLRRHGIGFEPY